VAKTKLLALLGSALIFAAPAAHAASVTLGSLIDNGGTITDGDKVFSDFSYVPTGAAPSADDIAVIPFHERRGRIWHTVQRLVLGERGRQRRRHYFLRSDGQQPSLED
jgi:hypothetical protein